MFTFNVNVCYLRFCRMFTVDGDFWQFYNRSNLLESGEIHMTTIYTVAMNKGGVGKTTLITNIATVMSFSKKVLLIDMDGQGNASMAFGMNPVRFSNTIYDVLLNGKSIENAIVSLSDNLDLLPANYDMNFFEIDVLPNLSKYKKPFELLKKAIEPIKDEYDYIFIDNPPSIGLVAGNSLIASNKVIVPFVPEPFAKNGLVKVLETINDVRKRDNPTLEVSAVVGMMIDKRTVLHRQLLNEAKEYCESKGIPFAETTIPRTITYANDTAYRGKPSTWDNWDDTDFEYFRLIQEVFQYGTESLR